MNLTPFLRRDRSNLQLRPTARAGGGGAPGTILRLGPLPAHDSAFANPGGRRGRVHFLSSSFRCTPQSEPRTPPKKAHAPPDLPGTPPEKAGTPPDLPGAPPK